METQSKKKEIIYSIFTFIIFTLFILLLFFGNVRAKESCTECKVYAVGDLIPAKVIKVVDGDTIWVKIINRKYKIRLIGINTPEIEHKNLHIVEQPYGQKAKEFTWFWLHDRQIWLELDLVWFDKYGRLLAYVWLKPLQTVTYSDIITWQFNAILLEDGYAKVMKVRPNLKYHKLYLFIQKQARQKHIGIWK